jgi:protein SCO1/2
MRIRPLFALLLPLVLATCTSSSQHWALNNVTGHLPDLAFRLTGDDGKPVDATAFRGKLVLLYFGYTHCPDVCPLAMTHLHAVMHELGAQADEARILFVSVDPARDTPALLHAYARAFDPRAVGLTGSADALRELAKRYRIAFSLGKPDANGNYEVTHSSAVFVFDRDGRARLLATSADDVAGIVHDLKQLLEPQP